MATKDVKSLVRSFSMELEAQINSTPNDPSHDGLARAIVRAQRCEDEREFNTQIKHYRSFFESKSISSNPEIAKLDREYNRLAEALSSFQNNLEPDDRITLSERPSVDTIIHLVKKAETRWKVKKEEGKWGTTKKFLNSVCGAIGSHATILQVLPAGSEYVSLFYGSVQILVQASLNYQKIADGLSQCLREICDAISICVEECELYQSEKLQETIADLYAHIFLMFEDMMGWYQRKSRRRLLRSFQEDYDNIFEDQITEIRRKSSLIDRQSKLAMGAEVRVTRMLLEDAGSLTMSQLSQLRLETDGIKRALADREYTNEKLRIEDEKEKQRRRLLESRNFKILEKLEEYVGVVTQGLLEQNAQASIARNKMSCNNSGQGILMQTEVPAIIEVNKSQILHYGATKDDIQLLSSHLEDFYDCSTVTASFNPSALTSSHERMISSIQSWTVSHQSGILHIVGPAEITDPSAISLVAVQYQLLCQELQVPTVSAFCKPVRKTPRQQGTDPLVMVIYCLIRQMIELLPTVLDANASLSLTNFERLDGSFDSLFVALPIIDALCSAFPPLTIIVLDGLQWVTDSKASSVIQSLLTVFQKHIDQRNRTETGGILKVLITTAGRSRSIISTINSKDIVLMEESRVGGSPGTNRRGRRSFSTTVSPALERMRLHHSVSSDSVPSEEA